MSKSFTLLLAFFFSLFTLGADKTKEKSEWDKIKKELTEEEKAYNYCFSHRVLEVINLSFPCVQQVKSVKGEPVQDYASPCFKNVVDSVSRIEEDCADIAENQAGE